jgi:hypothetical protein
MKRIYLLMAICAGAFLTSCSDDDDFNTGDANVSMKQPENAARYEVKENKLFKVPVSVNGEQNGPVRVTVEVSSNSADYVKDKNFIVTSSTVTIPAGKKEAGIEIQLVDDRIINEAERILTVKIISANGANIDSELASVDINVIDNDNTPYDRIIGKWAVSIIDGFTGTPMAWEAELTGYDDADENYGKEYLLTPLADANGNIISLETGNVAMPIKFKSVNVGGKETVELKITCGTIIAEGVNFDSSGNDPNLQDCRLRIVSLGATGMITSGQITGRLSDTFDSVEFDMPVICEILTKTNQTHGIMFWYTNMNLRMK